MKDDKVKVQAGETLPEAIARQTKARTERAIWDLWGWVRLNKDSLDSEKACGHIAKWLDARTVGLRTKIKVLKDEKATLKRQLVEERARIKKLHQELAEG